MLEGSSPINTARRASPPRKAVKVMVFRLKVDEGLAHGVRRIGVDQIDKAIALLTEEPGAGKAVHETRKGLKRIRALLRLVRPALSSDVFDAENARFRDIARSLSSARDALVLTQTIAGFVGKARGTERAAFKALAVALANGGGEAPSEAAQVAAIVALKEARPVFAELPVDGQGYEHAFEGMERNYRQAIRAFEVAFKSQHDEDMHTFRKRVQIHWRHMSLLSAAWPDMADARVEAARRLSTLLGEDHDIAVMRAAMGTLRAGRKGRSGLTAAQAKLIGEIAGRRQAAIREECSVLAQRLFAEPSEAFRARMERYWVVAGGKA